MVETEHKRSCSVVSRCSKGHELGFETKTSGELRIMLSDNRMFGWL